MNEGVNYGLLDAARDPGVREFILQNAPDAESLYAGLDETLVDVAPYLVPLTAERIDALMPLAWGNSWGVFVKSGAGIDDLRRHFRRFLMVQLEDGEEVYFRFYDPRVLRVFMPTCNETEWDAFFGPVDRFMVEDADPVNLLSFNADRQSTRRSLVSTL